MKQHNAPKPLTATGQRSELGRLLSAQTVRGSVHFNVAGQQANTLLHDGHAWKDFARVALAGVRRALRSDAELLVHASFAVGPVHTTDGSANGPIGAQSKARLAARNDLQTASSCV